MAATIPWFSPGLGKCRAANVGPRKTAVRTLGAAPHLRLGTGARHSAVGKRAVQCRLVLPLAALRGKFKTSEVFDDGFRVDIDQHAIGIACGYRIGEEQT